MGNWQKTLEQVLDGNRDANIRFNDLCHLLERLGFTARQAGGSHCIFKKPNTDLINLQNAGGKAKAYQVRQVREILKKSNP
jgi:predicted RNA binding protein YcfA (HicA-like mRNA interferase family)